MIPVPIGRCEFDDRNDAVSRFFVFHFLVSDPLSFFLKNDKRKPIWWRSRREEMSWSSIRRNVEVKSLSNHCPARGMIILKHAKHHLET